MPIHYDIRDHEVFGPVIRQERAQALAEGEKAGRRQESSFAAAAPDDRPFRHSPNHRHAAPSLAKLTLPELEDLAIRFVTAKNVNDLFRR